MDEGRRMGGGRRCALVGGGCAAPCAFPLFPRMGVSVLSSVCKRWVVTGWCRVDVAWCTASPNILAGERDVAT